MADFKFDGCAHEWRSRRRARERASFELEVRPVLQFEASSAPDWRASVRGSRAAVAWVDMLLLFVGIQQLVFQSECEVTCAAFCETNRGRQLQDHHGGGAPGGALPHRTCQCPESHPYCWDDDGNCYLSETSYTTTGHCAANCTDHHSPAPPPPPPNDPPPPAEPPTAPPGPPPADPPPMPPPASPLKRYCQAGVASSSGLFCCALSCG
eukprot:2306940-Prymnesium_polylepis.2